MKINQNRINRHRNSRASFIAEILFKQLNDGIVSDKLLKIGKRNIDASTLKGVKKVIKHHFLSEFPVGNKSRREAWEWSTLINCFERHEQEGESYVTVWVFKNEQHSRECIKRNIGLDGDSNHYDYSPTGLWFSNKPTIREFADRIIVTQSHHLDC